MRIQSYSSSLNYARVAENEEIKSEKFFDSLFLDEDKEKNKNNKPKLEVRIENGYVCKYVVKPNGEEKLIMKFKQPPNMEGIESESSSLTDIAIDMLMKQLDKPATPAKLNVSPKYKKRRTFTVRTTNSHLAKNFFG